MKFSKVLLGSAVLAAAAIGFMGCADDDDPNDMISGSNNNYSIEYTNDSTETSRGYNSTNLKHAGSLVKVNFDASSTTQGGVMGMIFDLHDGDDGKKLRCCRIKNYISRRRILRFILHRSNKSSGR
jgi:hypothetical protein